MLAAFLSYIRRSLAVGSWGPGAAAGPGGTALAIPAAKRRKLRLCVGFSKEVRKWHLLETAQRQSLEKGQVKGEILSEEGLFLLPSGSL